MGGHNDAAMLSTWLSEVCKASIRFRCWEFLWRETDATGKRVRRTAFIGTVNEYPTKELAQEAANGLRMQVNEDRNREPRRDILVEDLVDHYRHTELSDEADWHSLAFSATCRRRLTAIHSSTRKPRALTGQYEFHAGAGQTPRLRTLARQNPDATILPSPRTPI
jgi:hypothetical protein